MCTGFRCACNTSVPPLHKPHMRRGEGACCWAPLAAASRVGRPQAPAAAPPGGGTGPGRTTLLLKRSDGHAWVRNCKGTFLHVSCQPSGRGSIAAGLLTLLGSSHSPASMRAHAAHPISIASDLFNRPSCHPATHAGRRPHSSPLHRDPASPHYIQQRTVPVQAVGPRHTGQALAGWAVHAIGGVGSPCTNAAAMPGGHTPLPCPQPIMQCRGWPAPGPAPPTGASQERALKRRRPAATPAATPRCWGEPLASAIAPSRTARPPGRPRPPAGAVRPAPPFESSRCWRVPVPATAGHVGTAVCATSAILPRLMVHHPSIHPPAPHAAARAAAAAAPARGRRARHPTAWASQPRRAHAIAPGGGPSDACHVSRGSAGPDRCCPHGRTPLAIKPPRAAAGRHARSTGAARRAWGVLREDAAACAHSPPQ